MSEILGNARAYVEASSLRTPLLLFDETEILRALSYFERYLPDVKVFYAMKANPHLLLLDYFARRGLAFDVSSAQELDVVSQLGVSGHQIIFTNPIKGTPCLESLFRRGVRGYVVDNLAELEKISAFRRRHGFTANPDLYLRIRVKSKDVQIDLNRKFGCAPEDAPSLVKRARDLGLQPAGLAFHVGTQSYLAENFATGIRDCMLVAKIVRDAYGLVLSKINIGGGFPDPHLAQARGTSLDSLFAEVGTICRHAIAGGFTLYAEPGRILVSAAGILVTSVIGLADRSARRWVYLDDGVYGCYSGRSFDHRTFRFHALPGPGRSAPLATERVPFVVAGPTCDSVDLVDEAALLPADLAVGDYVCSPDMGAYSLATACGFNGFGAVGAALVTKARPGVPRQIRVLDDNAEPLELTVEASRLDLARA